MSMYQSLVWAYLIHREWETAARHADMDGRLWSPIIRNKAR